ncbi:MAG: dolichyl-phosphate-mannose--protein mannosyltransferase, partial [Candidatus Nanopelagicales bacterium]
LLQFGNEQQFVKDANDIILNSDGNPWTVNPFAGGPEYVVHPPLGKWVIAAGEAVFGATPTGWRVGVLVCGLIAVVLMARIVRRLLRSNLWGTVAGLFMALDGLAIVLSRTAVLDNVLMLCVLAAFGALLLDRDRVRRRVLASLTSGSDPTDPDAWDPVGGPRLGLVRPWRLVAAVMLGLACGVKWSGLWFVVAFGLLTVLWDYGLRRTVSARHPWRTTLFADAAPTALMWLVVIVAVYLATWTGWFLTDNGYYRDWATTDATAAADPSWLPPALRSLVHYHLEALRFHTNLTSPHSYGANPWGWPFQARPTSFYYETTEPCGADKCAAEVLALGNPLIWWAGVLAMFHQLWRWIGRRDWRSGAILCGFLAGWAPWLMFQERTVFEFYSIVFLPYVIMALTLSLAVIRGPGPDPAAALSGLPVRPRGIVRINPETRNLIGVASVIVFLAAIVVVSWWFYPIWTAQSIPYDLWNLRMWFPSWV